MTYRDFIGYEISEADREAIDGLNRELARILRHQGDGEEVGAVGSVFHATDLRGQPVSLWLVSEVTLSQRREDGGMSDQSYMTQASNLGLFKACEDYLLEFHNEPYRPAGWSSDLDLRAEALERLEELWSKEAAPESVPQS